MAPFSQELEPPQNPGRFMVAWQAITTEQQQLLQTTGLHRVDLEQQVCTLAILA
jgi:hypothetical protein